MDKRYVRYKDKFKVKHPEHADHLRPWMMKPGETLNPQLPDDHPKKRKPGSVPKGKGRWKPGESGNPKGRPIGAISIVERLRAYLRRHPEAVEDIVMSLVKEGRLGNLVATKEMLDRVDGKVTETHKIEGEMPIQIVFVPAQQLLKPKVEVIEGESKALPDGGRTGA